jgi:uncharacterized protein
MTRLLAVLFTLVVMGANTSGCLAQYSFDTRERPNYAATSIWYPPNLRAKIIAQAGQTWVKQTRKNGYTAVARQPETPDYMHFRALDTIGDHGVIIVNQETASLNLEQPKLGQGGSMTIIPVRWDDSDNWSIDPDPKLGDTVRSVDFTPVGWTGFNCGGTFLTNGHYLTGEEVFNAMDNDTSINRSSGGKKVVTRFDLNNPEVGYRNGRYTIPKDYPEFGGQEIAFHDNFGYMVEVDAVNARAVRKMYHMGRFSHESAIVMPDNKTVYLTDDYEPAVLYKYVADRAGVLVPGNLYAFRQDDGKNTGTWLPIERNLDSLLNARNVAIRKGATLFMRLEWGTLNPNTGMVYIAETGTDSLNIGKAYRMAGSKASVANHWKQLGYWNDNTLVCDHPYGSVLELDDHDPKKPSVRAFLNGGSNPEEGWNLASPDGLSFSHQGGRDWLIIQEDLIKTTRDRMPVANQRNMICEAFMLDLAYTKPNLQHLHRVFAGAPGAELAGALFTPLAKGFFINNQHPFTTNPAPHNASSTIAVTGYGLEMSRMDYSKKKVKTLEVVASPSLATLFFNQRVNYELRDSQGKAVRRGSDVDFVKFAGLPIDTYTVVLASGQTYEVVLR